MSARLSPLTADDDAPSTLSTAPPSRAMAAPKEHDVRVDGSKKALASTRRDSKPQPPDDVTMRRMSSATSKSDSTSGTVKPDTESTSAPGAKDMAREPRESSSRE